MVSSGLRDRAPIPHTSGIIERLRLLNKLKEALEHRLTLISAPPGYGKTTLAAQFTQPLECPVAWHTLDDRARDVPNLHSQCLQALRHIAPGIQSLSPRYGYAPSELATLITDHLNEIAAGHYVYVLDDVQHLTGSPAAEAWLRTFVEFLPSTCHLILISRMLPDLPYAEMITRREILAIGQEELRLTPAEIKHLAYTMLDTVLPEDEIQRLADRFEGWPAGTVLALHPLPAELERAMLSGGEGPEALFEALAEVMLHAQPSDMREFLLTSSTLSRLTPELCSAVLQLPRAAELFAEAQSRNLFLSKVSGGLVYHSLFRNFLQKELHRRNPERFSQLHIQAAQWFLGQNQLEEAFDHFIQAGLGERAAAISDRVAQAYFTQGKSETLLKWSAELDELGSNAPRLLCACSKIHTDRYEYGLAIAELNAAEKGFLRSEDEIGLADVQLQRAMLNLQKGHYDQAVSQAKELLDSDSTSLKVRGHALRIQGFARLRLGDVESGCQVLEEALPLHRMDGDSYALTNLLFDLEIAYTRLGRFEDAAACLQEVIALRRSMGDTGALALALNNLGYYYHRHGDYSEAMATFQEGLSVLARAPNRRAESYLLWSMGDLQRDRGAFEEALQLYNKALELLGNSEPLLRTAILISSSTLRRWQGEWREALVLAEEALAMAHAHNMALEQSTAEIAVWAVRARNGEAAEVMPELDRIIERLDQQSTHADLLHALGIYAHAALLCSDEETADRTLASAMQAGSPHGSMQLLAAEIVHTPLFDRFVSANQSRHVALSRFVTRLREAQLTPSPTDSSFASQVTYSIRVWTLGNESMERDGEAIVSSDWRTNTARELFLYLLFSGSETREGISLAFWPDSSPRQIRSSFHTTLYRARQAVGENTIVFEDGLYRINPDLDIWCDAQELESLVQRARLMAPRDARTEDLWRRAVNLYNGDFLPSLDAEWIYPWRETLQEAYIEALSGLGDCARARGDLREAIQAFKHALQVDPFREDVHRMVMVCYAERGERVKVVTHLRELEELLQKELAVEPSAKTMALVDTLLT